MGLDITAYSQIKRVADCDPDGDGLQISPAIIEWTEKHWPGRSKPVEPGSYTFAQDHRFRAGSYSGYNAWRDWLANVVGFSKAEKVWDHGDSGTPFFELINFADNEGVIGPIASAKLAKDFAQFEAKARAMEWFAVDAEYDMERYADWRKGFELAADNGCVDFH